MRLSLLVPVLVLAPLIACSSSSSNTLGGEPAAPTGPSTSTPLASPSSSPDDAGFVIANEQSNLAEIALGQLGVRRAQSSKVRELAEVTLQDHQRLHSQLDVIAKAKGLTLPTAPNAMQLAMAASLASRPASSFDVAFADAQVAGHVAAIARAKAELSTGTDSDLKTYATSYLPVATMHLAMARTARGA